MSGTSNPDEVQPYAPDGADKIGVPPSSAYQGEGGERGSSAFPGNSEFEEDGTLKDGVTPTSGPAKGVDYFVSDNQHRDGETRPAVESGGDTGDGK